MNCPLVKEGDRTLIVAVVQQDIGAEQLGVGIAAAYPGGLPAHADVEMSQDMARGAKNISKSQKSCTATNAPKELLKLAMWSSHSTKALCRLKLPLNCKQYMHNKFSNK
eukprot:354601-Amphidinium_carterae.1